MDFLYVDSKSDMLSDEEGNLEKVISKINENIVDTRKKVDSLKDERDNCRGDYENRSYFLECNEKWMIENNKLIFLHDIIENPYFGHMILSLNNEKIDLFIGYNSIDDTKFNKIVYDWRAPVCNLFYANQTEFNYKNLLYKLNIKRKISIQNRKIIECVETYNKNKENDDINDYFLRKLLQQKKKENGFTDIVQSIQKKQNEIIRSKINTNLVCQGVAGSGKTAIIVHRISYLLYNNPNISAKQFLFIAPNDNFKKELNELNKKLNIDSITLKTLYDYYIDKFNLYLNQDYNYAIRKIINDNKDNIDELYSYNNAENKYLIIRKMLLDTLKNYEKEYNITINTDSTNDVINNSKKLLNNFNKICDNESEKVKNIKIKLLNLIEIFKSSFSYIFTTDNKENTEIIKIEQINKKFYNLRRNFENIDINEVKNNIKANNEKLDNNNQTIAELIKEKANKNNDSFISRIINRKGYLENQNKLKEIDNKIFELNNENINIKVELDRLNNLLNDYDKLLNLNLLEDYAKEIEKLTEIVYKKKNYFKTILEDLGIQKNKIFRNIYYQNNNNNLDEINKVISKMEEVINEIGIVDWDLLSRKDTIKDKIKEKFTPKYVMLFYLNHLSHNKYNLDQEWGNIEFYRNDIFILLYIFNRLGFKKEIQFPYLYVDEAQDYNDLEIKLLKDIEHSNICVFGDFNQNISKNSVNRKDWSKLIEILGDNINYCELNENYRSTSNIVKYCNDNLGFKMLAVGELGEEVQIVKNKNIDDIIENARKIDAIIITNNNYIINEIKQKSNVRAITVEESKGLEFKNCIVVDDDLNKNERYIAYTRTLNNLVIYRKVK